MTGRTFVCNSCKVGQASGIQQVGMARKPSLLGGGSGFRRAAMKINLPLSHDYARP
jgi:hypothetical protein